MTIDLKWVDAAELAQSDLPDSLRRARSFFEALISNAPGGEQPLVTNVKTAGRLLRVGDDWFPVTINERDLDNSWICSPYNAAVTYPLEEVRHLPLAAARCGLSATIYSIAPLLQACRINKVVCVNNWLLSTNLYPEISLAVLQQITESLRDEYPGHAILFRSLNAATNRSVMNSLRQLGYLLAPSRQVYLFDGRNLEYLGRSNSKRDLKRLAEAAEFREVRHDEFQPSDFARIRELYNRLYLEKYSFHNPQFTERLLQIWHGSQLMNFSGLLSNSGQLDGILGTFAMNGVLTAPVVGYDTAQPQERGLYRLLMAQVLRQAASDRVLLNLSAGAASFKRLRGGQPELEYSAVYCRHLPVRQRLAWTGLAILLEQIGGRVLRRFQL